MSTITTDSHPLDHLFSALMEIVDRVPWHSEVQHLAVLAHLRDGEQALKADAPDAAAVVRPAPVIPEASAVPAPASGGAIDYDKLASAIVAAQKQQQDTAALQMAQAQEAVAATPGFETPGVAAPDTEAHAGAAAVADPASS